MSRRSISRLPLRWLSSQHAAVGYVFNRVLDSARGGGGFDGPNIAPFLMQGHHADIINITDKFFAPGPIASLLEAFVKGEGYLPTTTRHIRGLPGAWRRGLGKAATTRPSLLFMDLPDPSTPESTSRTHAAGSIPELVKENNHCLIPVFGVSGMALAAACKSWISPRA